MTLPVPTEAEEAKLLVAYLRLKGYAFHHSPNETGSSFEARRRAIRVKREGTSPGFPDYLIIVNKRLIAIEMKRQKGGVVSKAQKDWLGLLNEAKVQAQVCRGADEAIAFINEMENRPDDYEY